MINLEKNTKAAGAYVLHNGYFPFMFGRSTHHKKNELGVVRFGGHREKNETAVQCAVREVQEEASLDVAIDATLCPHTQLRFLNTLFKIEPELISRFMEDTPCLPM